jgi:hypothetical protein
MVVLCFCVWSGVAAGAPVPPFLSSPQKEAKKHKSGTTMSLASMLRSTLASPLTTWTYLAVHRAAFGASLNQIRSVWQEVVRQVSNTDKISYLDLSNLGNTSLLS